MIFRQAATAAALAACLHAQGARAFVATSSPEALASKTSLAMSPPPFFAAAAPSKPPAPAEDEDASLEEMVDLAREASKRAMEMIAEASDAEEVVVPEESMAGAIDAQALKQEAKALEDEARALEEQAKMFEEEAMALEAALDKQVAEVVDDVIKDEENAFEAKAKDVAPPVTSQATEVAEEIAEPNAPQNEFGAVKLEKEGRGMNVEQEVESHAPRQMSLGEMDLLLADMSAPAASAEETETVITEPNAPHEGTEVTRPKKEVEKINTQQEAVESPSGRMSLRERLAQIDERNGGKRRII
ncbi:hypothetical protein ACHAWF_001670 [Thalassiosira exigua]